MIQLFTSLPTIVKTGLLLCISNTIMLFAWYWHLKDVNHGWLITVILSWLMAFFEYLFMIPANRIGYSAMSVAQLKILQEVISLSVFVPFSIYYMKEGIKLNYIYAAICMVGAIYFQGDCINNLNHSLRKK